MDEDVGGDGLRALCRRGVGAGQAEDDEVRQPRPIDEQLRRRTIEAQPVPGHALAA